MKITHSPRCCFLFLYLDFFLRIGRGASRAKREGDREVVVRGSGLGKEGRREGKGRGGKERGGENVGGRDDEERREKEKRCEGGLDEEERREKEKMWEEGTRRNGERKRKGGSEEWDDEERRNRSEGGGIETKGQKEGGREGERKKKGIFSPLSPPPPPSTLTYLSCLDASLPPSLPICSYVSSTQHLHLKVNTNTTVKSSDDNDHENMRWTVVYDAGATQNYPTHHNQKQYNTGFTMKLEACRAFANLLLDRKGGNKGRQQPSRTPAGDRGQEDKKTKGRLYLSEPNLGRHNNSHSEPPINNQHHHHLKKTHNLKNTTTNQSHPDNHNNYNHKPKHNSESTRKRKGHINHNHNPTLNNNTATRQGVCVNDGAPPLPAHPPPPPPVPPHAQPLPQPPQQPLPPLPGQEETWREAPGTCILPRRGLVRDEMARYRSPSNPPPASRQPPPYSRHQPPQPQSRTRGPYHHPPPPKADSRDHRVSRNLEEMLDAPRNVRENQDPPPLREGWERRHEGWLPHQRWSTRQPDSGFDSMSVPMAGEDNRRRVDSPDTRQEEEQYQSTEDLARTSRASPLSLSSVSSSSSPHYPTVRPSKQPCLTSTTHIPPHPGPRPSPLSPSASSSGLGLPHHHSTPVAPPHSASPEVALLSDSVYPQPGPQSQSLSHPDHQPRYAEIQDAGERGSGDHRLHRLSCDVRDLSDSRDVCPPRHTSARRYRDTSLPRDFRDSRIPRSYPDQREERLGREGGGRNLEDEGERRGRRPLVEAGKEVRFSGDASENLRVRDAPSSERQWGGDGADGGTVRPSDQRRGDGCNASSSSSVSWMEWTQQLQAYVAWVNSQLRKRGGPLITDLRRDLQSGVVFADLIEIISGERVSGVSRGEDSTSSQVSRDNLERVLSFMAAKRIRMTHITSKEVTEGNLKSIMRVILALAAHYKPQSVKAAPPPPPTPPDPSPPLPHPHHYPATHDVGVGPDAPTAAPDKTPNLSTNRRALMDGGGDEVGAASLRRHPSMTAAPRDSSPVYENLPRRVAPHRWAYDSLRASHKFQWSGQNQQQRRPGPITGPLPGPNRTNLDESSDDPMNHTLNTSLNTSIEVDMEDSPRRSSRPAALNFWQELITQQSPPTDTKSHQDHPQSESPISLNSQHPQDDPNNPFRYHTIHRMSGRRKLPQIPGASSGGQTSGSGSSRGTTPQQDHPQHHQHHQEGSRGVPESPLGDKNSSTGGDEGSREPEGRSQNSSPAASLVRDSSLEPWENEDLKVVLRDLNSTREQLMALHTLSLVLFSETLDVTPIGSCSSLYGGLCYAPGG
ncbi:hypothetical protein Pmani_032870 [Petrolisthes manimaculis]|uniref:Calponin-homology (CH) domain-containing protein n=1 Tax=Petrolisthes manimaculis TaxID=1843537 RepID=A0AAE1NQY1_9EUCA|nr:hypothetical protein Pmani_032870 [Petrolisthes manimaculis]